MAHNRQVARIPGLEYASTTVKLREDARFSTICIHAGQQPDPSTGAIITPIYQTSTYVQDGLGRHKGYEYARTQNPTRAALEANIAAIEKGKAAFAFASGMAAEGAVMTLLQSGDHVVVTDNTYGGTYRLFEHVLRKYQLDFTYVDTSKLERDRAGDPAGDEAAVSRVADQPDAAADRPARRVRDRARARRRRGGGQHVCQPLRAAADRVRRRPGGPQHDQVPERPQRQRRRRRRRRQGRAHRVAAVRAERRGRHPRPDGRVAGAARHQDAADPHGAAQRERAGAGRVPRCASEGDARALSRACRHIRSTSWRRRQMCGFGGSDLARNSGRSRQGAHAARRRPADVAGRKPWRRGDADQPPGDDDARLGAARAAAGRSASPTIWFAFRSASRTSRISATTWRRRSNAV